MLKAKQCNLIRSISILMAVTLLLSLYYPSVVVKGASVNSVGNTCGNLNNDGRVAIQGDWIYYRNDALGGNLYKVKTDGTKKTKLNDDDVVYINVVGDWVYYFNIDGYSVGSPIYEIYKVKTDGTKRTEILHATLDCITSMVVKDNWIYYTSIGSIYKIKTDGTKNTDLKASGEISCIKGDYLYYFTYSGWFSGEGYRMKLDGTRQSKITDLTTNNPYPGGLWVGDTYVYYLQGDYYDKYLYKKPKDSSKRETQVSDADISICNIYGGWVYFIDDESFTLYKMKTDGNELQQLSEDKVQGLDGINIADGWIYYTNYDNEEFYRIRTDGSECELVEPY